MCFEEYLKKGFLFYFGWVFIFLLSLPPSFGVCVFWNQLENKQNNVKKFIKEIKKTKARNPFHKLNLFPLHF